jgi:HTH-type transcriptional regulator, sugar sensing transcriptional regulator
LTQCAPIGILLYHYVMTKIAGALLNLIGISHRDMRVYRALLAEQGSSIRRIAEKTDINRGSTYESIKNLSDVGLVTHVSRGSRSYYSAVDPTMLQQLLDDKLTLINEAQPDVDVLVGKLRALKPEHSSENRIHFYDDYEGIAVVLRDVLQTVSSLPDRTYYAYSSKALRDHLYVNFSNFKQRRVALGINVKVIAVGSGGDPLEMAERKWLPAGSEHEVASYTIVYGDKVATISLGTDLYPSAVVIHDPGVATMQKHIFNQLWCSL